MPTTIWIDNDEPCKWCAAQPHKRTCADCNATADITDCGHMSQPRPIAADERGDDLCDECYAARHQRRSEANR